MASPIVSRRLFLRQVGLLGTAVLLPGCGRALRTGGGACESPADWALLSDTHVDGTGVAGDMTARIRERLERVIDDVLTRRPRPADLLIDGDLAYRDGRPKDYALLLRLLQPARAAGINLHLVLGNHDHREHLLQAIHADSSTQPLHGRHVALMDSGGVRLFMLDSLIRPNYTPGELGAEQRNWLSRELDWSSDRPCVLFMHHNTSGGGRQLLDWEEFRPLLCARPQVKAVFQGHSHRFAFHVVEGIHFIELPAVAYTASQEQPLGWIRARLDRHGCDLELRALDGDRSRHGECRRLTWRPIDAMAVHDRGTPAKTRGRAVT